MSALWLKITRYSCNVAVERSVIVLHNIIVVWLQLLEVGVGMAVAIGPASPVLADHISQAAYSTLSSTYCVNVCVLQSLLNGCT